MTTNRPGKGVIVEKRRKRVKNRRFRQLRRSLPPHRAPEPLDLGGTQRAQTAGGEPAELDAGVTGPPELLDGVPHGLEHAPDLTVSPLGDDHFEPGILAGRDDPDPRRTRP